jgi:glycosyltransferase involved in cell wall biosynthesis
MNRVAIVHYWLVSYRGGEKVVESLSKIYPDADIFTHVYDPATMPEQISRHRVQTTFIDRLPGGRKWYQSYLPLMPLALSKLDLSCYDLIISSESGPAKGVRKPPHALHICYCHTPMRYLWDMADYYFKEASFIKKIGMKFFLPALRKWDVWSAGQVDFFVANSRFVAERINRIYGREATVIYPPVNVDRFMRLANNPQGYYLYFGQLTAYKRADVAVEAFNLSGRKLKIAGTGEERKKLEAMASGNIEFLGRVSDDELDDLYAGAEALVFPGIEDFGIVPVEAQAAGCPVIALAEGGALETVIDGVTGILFQKPEIESLNQAIDAFENSNLSSQDCKNNALRFSEQRFLEEFSAFAQRKLIAHHS